MYVKKLNQHIQKQSQNENLFITLNYMILQKYFYFRNKKKNHPKNCLFYGCKLVVGCWY